MPDRHTRRITRREANKAITVSLLGGPDPEYADDFNRSTATYIPGGIRQLPEENALAALERHGVIGK